MSDIQPSSEVCGTDRGYQRHRYRGTAPCQPCANAHREYERARRQRPKTPVRELAPPSGWQDKAACVRLHPSLFDPSDYHTEQDFEALKQAAQAFCTSCPVIGECAAEGDFWRLQGTWGGSYRYVQHNEYKWRVFADGAPEPQPAERRPGVRSGWVA